MNSDELLFDIFGSHAPKVLRHPHRLVRCATAEFQGTLERLTYQAANFGSHPPSILTLKPDCGVDSPPFAFESFLAWREAPNQRDLIDRIENYKYCSSLTLICSTGLSVDLVSEMATSEIGRILLHGSADTAKWYDTLSAFLDRCRWFYLPLPEYTEYDLWVFSDRKSVV